ncbi:MAG TPA: D-alanyl-D-alanine carboxypeptidase/D-alanyl-D-alanine-endopeptidase [Burkholderiaceae bacterium]|nr:D-alanyl-D-alanine carboxypeptidase/D-alanyl-D-alanine-endopeptidase [Burkholderiaceae bacterium]
MNFMNEMKLRIACRCTLTVLLVASSLANAQPAPNAGLPDAVAAALKLANVPSLAIGIVVTPLAGPGLALAVNESQPMNPASTMKLVTTLAGLELLGPQYQWRTDLMSAAPVKNGVLEGDLWLRGSGDPQLVIEDLWLLVQRLRGVGVREIRGNLMLDRSAFEAAQHDPGAFDGEATRPYNAGPDALLLNYKAVSFHFIADPDNKQARVYALPALAGLVTPTTVRSSEGACNDWRARLGGDFTDPLRPTFRGSYPLSCGDKVWHVSMLDTGLYAEAIFRPLWESSGGIWRGRVRDGLMPPEARRLAQHESRPLAEVIRDINKYSNNVMARQLFLTLGADASRKPANKERAQRAVGDWLVSKSLDRREFVLENGAGLSRVERLTAAGLARLLQGAFASPLMPEFVSSLPIVGIDGTMRRRQGAAGSAHIKTGLLSDTRAIAGYVLAASGKRYAVVAFINHPNAGAGQPALDALLNWIYVQG